MASTISAGTTSATALVHTADTTGALELKTNNGTTALTLSTAQNATFAGTLTTAAKGIAKASLPAGAVLQVVSTTVTTFTSSTSTTDITVGLTATITPTSTSSKILVMYSLQGGTSDSYNATIYRGATAICTGTSGASLRNSTSSFVVATAGSGFLSTQSQQFLDSPATTSATTYDIKCNTNGGTFYVNRRPSSTEFGSTSTVTLMEIAA